MGPSFNCEKEDQMTKRAVDPKRGEWQRFSRGALSVQIGAEILRHIEANKLVPGDRLPSERDLAELLGVSRPSLREALRSLQAHGKIVVKHGQGAFMAESSTEQALRSALSDLDHDLVELFEMREVLEVPAAFWAAERRSQGALESVEAAFKALDACIDRRPEDFDELQKLDALFHLRIVQASGRRLLEEAQNVMSELMEKGMRTTLEIEGRISKSREEHLAVLDHIRNQDAAGAAEAARFHVQSARLVAEQRLRESGGQDLWHLASGGAGSF